eukprot:14023680-Alexandrium_andersonii.AAC.1
MQGRPCPFARFRHRPRRGTSSERYHARKVDQGLMHGTGARTCSAAIARSFRDSPQVYYKQDRHKGCPWARC